MFITTVLLNYLLGSIPSGLLLAKIFYNKDLRMVGSHNIGATNAYRAGGLLLGIYTLILDVLKGAILILIVRDYYTDYQLATIGLMAVIGHVFPIWLRFKGGKGIATMLGVLLTVQWKIGLMALGLWSLIFATCRISAVASLLTTFIILAFSIFIENHPLTFLQACLFIIILWSHKSNIKRLLQGKERKL